MFHRTQIGNFYSDLNTKECDGGGGRSKEAQAENPPTPPPILPHVIQQPVQTRFMFIVNIH